MPSQVEIDRLLRIEKMAEDVCSVIAELLAEEEPHYSPAGTLLTRDVKRQAMLDLLSSAEYTLTDAGARYRAYLYLHRGLGLPSTETAP